MEDKLDTLLKYITEGFKDIDKRLNELSDKLEYIEDNPLAYVRDKLEYLKNRVENPSAPNQERETLTILGGKLDAQEERLQSLEGLLDLTHGWGSPLRYYSYASKDNEQFYVGIYGCTESWWKLMNSPANTSSEAVIKEAAKQAGIGKIISIPGCDATGTLMHSKGWFITFSKKNNICVKKAVHPEDLSLALGLSINFDKYYNEEPDDL
jgi:hypothetical protein